AANPLRAGDSALAQGGDVVAGRGQPPGGELAGRDRAQQRGVGGGHGLAGGGVMQGVEALGGGGEGLGGGGGGTASGGRRGRGAGRCWRRRAGRGRRPR